jgi:hypothetical protein
MKIKMAREVRELIDKMSLNEYLSQSNGGLVQKKRDMIDLDTHDALLARNKHISIQLETILKKLEAKYLAQLSSHGLVRDLCD